MQKLDIKAFAAACGIAWAAGILFLGWAAAFGWGGRLVEVISSVYIGYRPTVLGAVVGALWALVDGAIGGAIIALLYNVLAGKG